MSFSELLIHKCRIQKDVPTGSEDDLGNPKTSRELVASLVPCWFTVKRRALLTSEAAGPGVSQIYSLYTKPDQEIAEGYLIDQIVFEDQTAHGVSYRVVEVYPMRMGSAHHSRAILERLS